MAQPIPCDTCGEFAASVVLNVVADADVKGFCPDCFADFAEAFTRQVRPEAFAPAQTTTKTRGRKKSPAAAASSIEGGDTDGDIANQEAGTAAGIGESGGRATDTANVG